MGKKTDEELPGKQLLEDVKNKSKKETEMKNIKENTTIKTIVTVAITLLSVAAIVASFLGGMHYQSSINDQVKTQVKDVVSAIKVEPSKQ